MLYEVKGYMKEFLKKMHYMVERRDCGANDIEFFFFLYKPSHPIE